jgi:hypothetical protein
MKHVLPAAVPPPHIGLTHVAPTVLGHKATHDAAEVGFPQSGPSVGRQNKTQELPDVQSQPPLMTLVAGHIAQDAPAHVDPTVGGHIKAHEPPPQVGPQVAAAIPGEKLGHILHEAPTQVLLPQVALQVEPHVEPQVALPTVAEGGQILKSQVFWQVFTQVAPQVLQQVP